MSAIFDSLLCGGFSLGMYLACLAGAGLCGLIAACLERAAGNSSRSFRISLVVLPMVVCTVILMVNGSVGTGIAVAGAFSLVRFRSVAGKAREIAVIFLVMTAGLACGAGYVVIALVFTVLVSLVMLVLSRLSFGEKKLYELHITVPETLQLAGAFDDLFDRYTNSHALTKTRTSNMGSLYRLSYTLELKDPAAIQAFLNELRCRNGNLDILLSEKQEGDEVL